MGDFEGAPLPARPECRWYDVVSPTHLQPIDCVVLGGRFFGCWTHWIHTGPLKKGITMPCSMDEHCVMCKEGRPNRWSGYLAVLTSKNKEEKILTLSEGAARQLLPFRGKYGTLRSLQFVFRRARIYDKQGKLKENARIEVDFVLHVQGSILPPEFSVQDSLSRLWGINAEHLKKMSGRPNVNIYGSGAMRRPRDADDDQGDGVMIPVA